MSNKALYEIDELTEGHERTVLSTLMNDMSAREVIVSEIQPRLFACEKHRLILSAIFELLDDGKEPGLLAVCQCLESANNLKRIGGRHYVTEVQDTTGSLATARFALTQLRERSALRRQSEIADQMQRGAIKVPDAILQLTELCEPESESRLTTRSAAEILSLKLDANDCLMGDRLFAKGQSLVLAGIGGIGKSRLLLQLAVCCITGRSFCGFDTHAEGLRWLILQTENSNRRLQLDLCPLRKWCADEWSSLEGLLVIHTVETDRDAILSLADSDVRRRIDEMIQRVKPDIVAIDPLRDLMAGDPNSDEDMASTIAALGALCRRGNPQRAIVVLHHALTGKTGASKAFGFERSSFARNSKVLFGWTRAQINVAPGSADNNETLLLTCGKNSNGKEFEPSAIRLNPQSMIYEPDELFDIDSWREEISGGKSTPRRTFPPQLAVDALEGRELKKRDLAAELISEHGCGKSRAYTLIEDAERKRLIKLDKATKTYAAAA